MKPHIEVAAGIILHQDNVLIAQRGVDSHLSGYWEFPGGKREPDESFEACLVREIREELNIEIEVQQFFQRVLYEYAEKTVTLMFYSCRYVGGETEAKECQQFRWVPVPSLKQYQFPPANQPVLEKLLGMAPASAAAQS
ncbi:MAG: 8-oxo-dGTP diphosphatase MutT [Acidobacteriota bacterium]